MSGSFLDLVIAKINCQGDIHSALEYIEMLFIDYLDVSEVNVNTRLKKIAQTRHTHLK